MKKDRIQSILNRYLVYVGFILASIAGDIAWLFQNFETLANQSFKFGIALFGLFVLFFGFVALLLDTLKHERTLEDL